MRCWKELDEDEQALYIDLWHEGVVPEGLEEWEMFPERSKENDFRRTN